MSGLVTSVAAASVAAAQPANLSLAAAGAHNTPDWMNNTPDWMNN